MTRILSFGGGIQTAYLLFAHPERYDYCVWADVAHGSKFDEKARTYWFIENIVIPFCKAYGIPFITVQAYTSLFKHCILEKIIPNTRFRWCTKRFKITPIRKWVKQTLKASKHNVVVQDIGFSYDEFWRAEANHDTKFLKTEHPLVDMKITRDDCKEFLMNFLGFLPPKSGCVYCPFAGKTEFRKVAYEEKLKVPAIVFMEHNNRRYKNKVGKLMNTLKVTYHVLGGRKKMVALPIEKFLHPANSTLDDFAEKELDTCLTGHCFH